MPRRIAVLGVALLALSLPTAASLAGDGSVRLRAGDGSVRFGDGSVRVRPGDGSVRFGDGSVRPGPRAVRAGDGSVRNRALRNVFRR